MINHEIFAQIISKIDELKNDFLNNPAIILTENDLQCLIFHKLYHLFDHNLQTFNLGINGSPLHSELKFFDENGKLYIRPDITILDPQNLSIRHSIYNFKIVDNKLKYDTTSSKKFEFGGDLIIIEMKFYRGKAGVTKTNAIQKDVEKIKRIQKIASQNNNNSNIFGLLVVFNKYNKTSRKFNDFMDVTNQENQFKIIYGSSRLE